MGWQISPRIADILNKGSDNQGIKKEEALMLMGLELYSRETYALMETANRLSRMHYNTKGENHLHIGINVAPCPLNCVFCSLAEKAGIFRERKEFPETDILNWARWAESESVDALNRYMFFHSSQFLPQKNYGFAESSSLLSGGIVMKQYVVNA